MAEPEKLDKELDKVVGGAAGDYPYMVVDKNMCICCSACISECPTGAISGEFVIDNSKCVKCNSCLEVCPRKTISRVPRGQGFNSNNK